MKDRPYKPTNDTSSPLADIAPPQKNRRQRRIRAKVLKKIGMGNAIVSGDITVNGKRY